MSEWSSNTPQIVPAGQAVVFQNNPAPCTKGLVTHRDDTGLFMLKGVGRASRCPCVPKTTNYLVSFGGNIAIPTGGTVEAISLEIYVNGAPIPYSTMISTPAAVEQYQNVGVTTNAPIEIGCCQSVSVVNTSAQDISVENANIVFEKR